MLVKVFGYTLASGTVVFSLIMMLVGRRFQRLESAAYAGERRPMWFWVASAGLISFYLAALVDFMNSPKTAAGWLLMVVAPLGWLVKAALVTFNPKGRQAVMSLSEDTTWRKIALARLPVAVVLFVLAWFA